MSVEPLKAPPRTYPIGDLCREFGVTPRTLRYYEELRLLTPRRDGRVRRYSAKDRARLFLILQGRAGGMRLAEVAYLLDVYKRGGRAAQHAGVLSSFRRQLQLLEARREAAEQGIAMLRSAIEQLSTPDQVQVPGRGEAEPGLGPSGNEHPAQAESSQPGGPSAHDADVTSTAPFVGRSKEDLVHGA